MSYRRTGEGGESVVEQAVAAIRQRVRNGQFAPGQRLVAGELSAILGVSGGPIREALTRLAGEGIVEVQPHRGAIVRTQTREDLVEIYALREVIEGLLARLAAEAVASQEASPRALKMATEKGRKLVQGLDLPGYLEANEEFHEAIYALAGKSRVITLARQLSDQIDRLNNRHLASLPVLRRSADEHEEILEAVLVGDGDLAEKCMRKHVSSMGRKIVGADG